MTNQEIAKKALDDLLKEEELKKVNGGNDDRVYKCPICGVSFAMPYTYQIHMKAHWHEK